jgi:hypothetical protein
VYHTITFVDDLILDLETSSRQHLERLEVRKGTRVPAQLKPFVVETAYGPVEMADLFFEDGTAVRAVPFAYLTFLE